MCSGVLFVAMTGLRFQLRSPHSLSVLNANLIFIGHRTRERHNHRVVILSLSYCRIKDPLLRILYDNEHG